MKNFYPSTFPGFWSNLDSLSANGTILSVREVYNELLIYNDTDSIQSWAKQHKAIFAKPSDGELQFVGQIFAVPHFKALISNTAILKGTPVADPFVVAAAKIMNAAVVTEESLKPNAAKIPNVCGHFGIPCMNLEAFMAQQRWTF